MSLPPPLGQLTNLDDNNDVASGQQPGEQMDGLHVDAVLGGGEVRRIFPVMVDQVVQDGDREHRL